MSDMFDLKIESEVVRAQIDPVSRKEILEVAIQALQQTLSTYLSDYEALKKQMAVDELLHELVGEGLVPVDNMQELRREAREKENWLEKWSQHLQKLENTLDEQYPELEESSTTLGINLHSSPRDFSE